MPTVSYNKSELKKLVGRRISDEQLADVITLVKPNLEAAEGENITIEHTPDRSDLFGIEGLARSIQNYLGLKKGVSKYSVFKPKMKIKMSSVPARAYVSAAVVRKVRMDEGFIESMINIQELLNDSLGRGRRKAAIGIHDFDKINGPVSYLGAHRDEEMVPLEFKESMTLEKVLEKVPKGREFGEILKGAKTLPVFKDSKGIFSFPPIINSDRTRVTEKTKNLFVEVTGTDKQTVRQVMSVLASNFGQRKFSLEGVKLQFEKRSEVTPDLSESVVEISAEMVNKTLGLSLSAKEIIDLLKRAGFDALGSADKMEVIVPAYRNDILHPIDIVEDVAIAYGYNNMKPELPNISTIGKPLEIEKLCQRVSSSLVGFGFQEVLTSVLSNRSDQFDKMDLPATRFVEIENPSSRKHDIVRTLILPGLLKFLSANRNYGYPQNIFEVGDVVLEDKSEETLYRNQRKVAGAICHSKAGFAELRSVVDGVMRSLQLGYTTKACTREMYIPGRGVDMYVNKKYVGSFGEIHPRVIEMWEIGMPVAAFEIVLENIV